MELKPCRTVPERKLNRHRVWSTSGGVNLSAHRKDGEWIDAGNAEAEFARLQSENARLVEENGQLFRELGYAKDSYVEQVAEEKETNAALWAKLGEVGAWFNRYDNTAIDNKPTTIWPFASKQELMQLARILSTTPKPIAVFHSMAICEKCHGNFGTVDSNGVLYCDHCGGLMIDRKVIILPAAQGEAP